MRDMNAHPVTVKMRDGSIFRGYINIGSCRRLSDYFRKPDVGPFIVMFETTVGKSMKKGVYFINWLDIQWVKPNEAEEPLSLSDGVVLEGEIK